MGFPNYRIEHVYEGEGVEAFHVATIVHYGSQPAGVNFVTNDRDVIQVATINLPDGAVIARHYHPPTKREIRGTPEVLLIRRGILEVKFWSGECEIGGIGFSGAVGTYTLHAGDLVIIHRGGHSFKVIEEVEMVEVKQGPYLGDRDKVRY